MVLRASHVQEGSCYTSELERLGVARNALYFALSRLERSPAVQNINKLLEIAKMRDKARDIGRHEEGHSLNFQIHELVDVYLDDFIIIAAYENYLKAKLLIYGYVVHKVDSGKENSKIIATKQNREPLKIIDLADMAIIQNIGVTEEVLFQYLKQKTLDITTLLDKKKYRDALQIPPHISEKLLHTIFERNKIHYWVVQMVNLSASRFEDIKMLADYLKSDARKLLHHTENRFHELRYKGVRNYTS